MVIGDFNGDGKVDLGRVYGAGVGIYQATPPAADLLSTVTNSLGGTSTISYTPSSTYTNTLMPFVLQTVSSISNNDGKGNILSTTYTYEGGLFDYTERDFRGFRKATSYQMADSQSYESKTETWYLQDYFRKGKIETQILTSKEGHTKQISNNWLLADTAGGGKFPYLDTATTTVTDQGEGGPFSFSQTTKDVYDIRPSDLINQTLNLLEEHKNEGSPEEIVTRLEYTAALSKITKATVTNSSGTIFSRKWMDYDANGNLITEEVCKSDTPNTGCLSRNSTQNVVTYYQYDPTYKVLTQVTDPRGYVTTITYDSTKTFVYGSTKCIEGGKCFTTTTEYDPGTGKLTKSIPPHLQGTPYWLQTQYDVFGRKTLDRVKDNSDPNASPVVDRGSTSYFYNDTGSPNTQYVLKPGKIVIEGAPERTLTLNGYTYFDGLGRTYWVESTGPQGKRIVMETWYDNLGRVWDQSNPYFYGIDTPYYTSFTYDGLSRVIDVFTPDNYHISTSYQGLTKVVSKQVSTSNWQSTAYTYDRNQKLTQVKEALGVQGKETATTYQYDTLGNLIQVTAAVGMPEQNVTSMSYDSLLKKRGMTDPDMGGWTYGYDKMGNLISQTDARNQTITFTCDGLNRLTQKTYPTNTVTFTYDDPTVPNSWGKLTKISYQPSGEDLREDRILEYDLMQRLTKSQKTIGAQSVTFQKSYDSAGRVISVKYLAGTGSEKTYTYEYDATGDLLSVKDNATGNHLIDYSDFTALGQQKIATFPKPNNVSVKTTYTYDSQTARLKTLLTQKLLGANPTDTYQNLDYQQFDGKGNLITLADALNAITHSFTYDPLNRLLTANGVGTNAYTQSFQYDRIGNITYKSDFGTYTYDYSNKPHAVKSVITDRPVYSDPILDITYNYDNKPEYVKTNGSNYVQFTYDGNGQRVKKYNFTTGQTTLYFGSLYEVRGGVGIIHVFAGNRRVASVFADGTGRTQFYHSNHLGSSSVITDGNGDKKEKIEYFPFGEYRAVGNTNGTYDYDPNFPDVYYTFTGQEDDDDLGFYNYGARLYDPVLGRFISPDSIVQAPGDPQTLNRYSYARNNPLIYIDPSGNVFGIDDIILAISVILVNSVGVTSGATAYMVAATIAYTAAGVASAAGGAALGAATSAIMGGDVGLGALTGAISGALFFGAGEFAVPAVSGALGATTPLAQAAVTVGVHMAAGAVSGTINSAITGSDIGMGALTGAAGAGIGAVTGGALKYFGINQFGYQFVARTVMGGVAGGVVSHIYGGNFWQGFGQGAGTAGAAFLFNCASKTWKQALWEFISKHVGVGGVFAGIEVTYDPSTGPTATNVNVTFPQFSAGFTICWSFGQGGGQSGPPLQGEVIEAPLTWIVGGGRFSGASATITNDTQTLCVNLGASWPNYPISVSVPLFKYEHYTGTWEAQ